MHSHQQRIERANPQYPYLQVVVWLLQNVSPLAHSQDPIGFGLAYIGFNKWEWFQLQRHCKHGSWPTTSPEQNTSSCSWYHSKHLVPMWAQSLYPSPARAHAHESPQKSNCIVNLIIPPHLNSRSHAFTLTPRIALSHGHDCFIPLFSPFSCLLKLFFLSFSILRGRLGTLLCRDSWFSMLTPCLHRFCTACPLSPLLVFPFCKAHISTQSKKFVNSISLLQIHKHQTFPRVHNSKRVLPTRCIKVTVTCNTLLHDAYSIYLV